MNEYEIRILNEAKIYCKSILKNEATGHDYFHVMRVMNMAKRLSQHYEVNLFVIQLTALLHDLDDYKISEKGSDYASRFLETHQVKEKGLILSIIENMSYSAHKEGKAVSSLEGQIIQDADRLDALGAIGIARVFAYSGRKNRPIYKGEKDDDSAIAHFYDKLLKLPELMNTEEAKKIANERVNLMKTYLENFYSEWSDSDERI